MASWTPWMFVWRSSTICEIDTFMTLLSSTITNCAAPKIAIGKPNPLPERAVEVAPAAAVAELIDRILRSGAAPDNGTRRWGAVVPARPKTPARLLAPINASREAGVMLRPTAGAQRPRFGLLLATVLVALAV